MKYIYNRHLSRTESLLKRKLSVIVVFRVLTSLSIITVLFIIQFNNFLLFHHISVTISVVIGFLIFEIIWSGRDIIDNQSHEQNRTIFAERLLENLSMPYLDDKISFVSCSIGIAASNNGNTAKNLLSRADSAMYIAIKTGKNRFVYDNTGKLSTSTL